jgi:hypothetical protein
MRIALAAIIASLCATVAGAQAAAGGGTFAVTHVETDRVLKIGRGFASTYPYEPIAQSAQDFLSQKLTAKGMNHVEVLTGPCCKITIELQEMAEASTLSKAGMDVSATVTVADAGGQKLYSKGYHGEAKSMATRVNRLLQKAAENLADNIASDPDLVRVLTQPDVAAHAQPLAAPIDVKVGSIPEDAEIQVNGTFLGNTPSVLRLVPGEYRIAITKEGHSQWERTLKVGAGSAISVHAELTPVASAPAGSKAEPPPFLTTATGARVREEFLADVPTSGKSNLDAIPYRDGRKVLYWTPGPLGLTHNVISETGLHFDGVRTTHPLLSPDRRHLAIAIGILTSVKSGTYKWDLLLDGRLIPCQADEISRLVFSPNGRRLAFAAKYGQDSLIRAAGEEDGPKHEWVGPPAFSPDSTHLIYAAGSSTQVEVLIDHKVVSSQEAKCSRPLNVRSDDLAFSAFVSPDSKSWAVATTNCSGLQSYNINGKLEGEPYGALSPITFSPDGQHHAYLAVKLKHGMWTAKGAGLVVVDGKPSPEYEGLGLPPGNGTLRVLLEPNAVIFGASAPRYTADGHLLYVAHTKTGSVLIQDGEAGPQFDEILTDPVTSGGGQHIAYMAVRNKELLAVVDGKITGLGGVVPWDDFSFIEWVGFAPGGKLAAILNKHGKMWSEDMHARRRILLDGKLGTQYDCLGMTAPSFSSDGLHYAYAVAGIKNKGVKGAPQNVPRVVVDELESPDYSSIDFTRKWLEGGAAVYYAVKDGKLYRVTQQGR